MAKKGKNGIGQMITNTNGFLYFSKSQRIAVLVLSVGFLLFFLAGKIYVAYTKVGLEEPTLVTIAELNAFVAQQNSTEKKYREVVRPDISLASDVHSSYGLSSHSTNSLFFFDPNTATQQELQQLGLHPKAAMNIINYRTKGGRFNAPEDLKKIYALHPAMAEKLIPFVKISLQGANLAKKQEEELSLPLQPAKEERHYAYKVKEMVSLTSPLDINLADSFSLTLLPGIGAKRAGAICRYREKLGGFASFEQIAETYGLPDSVYEAILPYITLGNGPANKISINQATENTLKQHPYIGWKMAKIIIAYREQHGSFGSVDDLLKIYAVKKDWLDKVKPYLHAE